MNRRWRGNALCLLGVGLLLAGWRVLPVMQRVALGVGFVYAATGLAVVAAARFDRRLTPASAAPVAILSVSISVVANVYELGTGPSVRHDFATRLVRLLVFDAETMVCLVVALSVVYAASRSSNTRTALGMLSALPFVSALVDHGDQGFGYGVNVPFYTVAFLLGGVASLPVYLGVKGWRQPGTRTEVGDRGESRATATSRRP